VMYRVVVRLLERRGDDEGANPVLD
jgi:hypothetical protein